MSQQHSNHGGDRFAQLNTGVVAGRKLQPTKILREIGAVESDDLTSTGTDVSAGQAALFNYGPVSRDSVGKYRAEVQSNTAGVPLGAMAWVEFQIRESTAGVFVAELLSLQATQANDSGTDVQVDPVVLMQDTSPTDVFVGAVDISGAGEDSEVNFSVAAADEVSDAAAAYPSLRPALAVNDLFVIVARAAGAHRVRIVRVN